MRGTSSRLLFFWFIEDLMEHLTKVNEKQYAAVVGSVHWKLASCMVANQ